MRNGPSVEIILTEYIAIYVIDHIESGLEKWPTLH